MAEAGKYELLDLLWDQRVNDVEKPVPVFKRWVQGDVVELDEAEATRLVEAGSVAPEGERERQALAAAEAQYRAALANVPDHLKHLVVEAGADAASLRDREVPVEERTVHTAPGFTNEGHPKYAGAAHGEGSGEGPEDTTVADLDATQASLDDGGKDTRQARAGVRERGTQPGEAAARSGGSKAAKSSDDEK
jgi:hypothetical protein